MKIVGLEAIKAEYIQHCGSDLMVVRAAKVSTGKEAVEFGEKEQGLIRFLARNHHDTPFEMIDVTFLVEVPIFIARQFHRHRTMSYNEWSGRYSVVGDAFYVPKQFLMQGKMNKQGSEEPISEADNKECLAILEYQCIKSFDKYEMLLEKGISKEMARMILPQNMMTKFYAKSNLRNWMHYCSLRCDSHAQLEHQHVAMIIFTELLKMFPVSTGALAKGMFNDEILDKLGLLEKVEAK